MSATDAVLNKAEAARASFLKHLNGLKPEQWDFKPFPQCNSIRETVLHLLLVDRATLISMQTKAQPDWDNYDAADEEKTAEPQQLLQLITQANEAVFHFLRENAKNSSLEEEVVFWGEKTSLAEMCISMAAHDAYHAGQASFLRQASDPEWDYYAAIYG